MNTKIDINIKELELQLIKKYAEEGGQSLSELVENYFKFIIVNRKKMKPEELTPRIQRLRGIMKVGEDFNHKKILTEELEKKYEN